eukprot:m.977571 g.977571  ORF g.977571 m.977571 type:complete len:54 (+) comp23954_c1_seq1:853-1014(+)
MHQPRDLGLCGVAEHTPNHSLTPHPPDKALTDAMPLGHQAFQSQHFLPLYTSH